MKIIAILIAASMLVVGCAPSLHEVPALSDEVPTRKNQVDSVQLTARIQDVVRETSRTVVIGENTSDRIRNTLLKQLSDVSVAGGDTNISINVNCGDPIYHIEATISGGRLVAVEVEATPICLE